jgi:quinol-cytochrome oxidoreductase complex cytochrome b subunit
MWCLALVNIVAFLFDHELSDRITILSLIMLGYLILIVINQNKNYCSVQTNFIDINRLLMFIIVVCYLFNSLWQSTHHINPKQNLFFLFCISLLGASIFLVIMFILIHKICWEPSYKKSISDKI